MRLSQLINGLQLVKIWSSNTATRCLESTSNPDLYARFLLFRAAQGDDLADFDRHQILACFE